MRRILVSYLILFFAIAACWKAHAQLAMMGAGPATAGVAGGAVTFNSKAVADTGGEALTSLSITNMTVGSGVNRALLLLMGFSSGLPTGLTATWDSAGTNQAMTSIKQYTATSTPMGVAIFGLINPTSGNKTLSVSWTGSKEADANVLDFTHVNQTGGATSFPHTSSNDDLIAGNSTAASATVTSAANNGAVAMFITNWLWSVGSATQTEVWMNNALSASAYEGQRAAGAASVSFGVTVSAAGHNWGSVAADIAHD